MAGIVALMALGACSADVPPPAGAEGADLDAEEAGDTSATDSDPELASRRYVLGDCVEWAVDGTSQVDTDIVDCTTPHRMQIAGKYVMPYSEDYPAPEAWDALHVAGCLEIVEEKLVELDPYGRFGVRTIIPTEESWANSDRTVWCGVGAASADPEARISEDVRTADQAVHYAVGECVAVSPDQWPAVVPCDQPHHWEIVGQADFTDLAAVPTEEEILARCTGPAEQYSGGGLGAPWAYSYQLLDAASWDAGTRTVPCYLAQWDAAGNQMELVGPARG